MKFKGIERETFLEHFTFDFENGKVYWKKPTAQRVHEGDIAGTVDAKGYLTFRFKNKSLKAHRLIYWIYYETDMDGLSIDHKNGIRSDNSIKNLRLCSNTQNARNRVKANDGNNTGFRGICEQSYKSGTKHYHARVFKNAKPIFEKRFPYTPEGLEQAKIAVLNARKKHFGEYSGDN